MLIKSYNLSQLSAKILEGKTFDSRRNWQLNWAVFSKACNWTRKHSFQSVSRPVLSESLATLFAVAVNFQPEVSCRVHAIACIPFLLFFYFCRISLSDPYSTSMPNFKCQNNLKDPKRAVERQATFYSLSSRSTINGGGRSFKEAAIYLNFNFCAVRSLFPDPLTMIKCTMRHSHIHPILYQLAQVWSSLTLETLLH